MTFWNWLFGQTTRSSRSMAKVRLQAALLQDEIKVPPPMMARAQIPDGEGHLYERRQPQLINGRPISVFRIKLSSKQNFPDIYMTKDKNG